MIGADILALSFKAHGINYLLGIPGHESVIMNSFQKYGLEFITTRHEQAAAFAADGVGRIKHYAGVVCYSTFGPGATNLLTGVASAFSDRSPLIAFCPQVKNGNYHPTEGHQSLDLVSIFKPVTKYAVQINQVEDISKEVAIGFKIASSERQGPVFLTSPLDVLETEAEALQIVEPLPIEPLPFPASEKMNLLLKLIQESTKPLLIVGGVINRLVAHKELNDFVAKLKIPVITTFLGKSSLPESTENCLGTISSHELWAFDSIFEVCDLILFIGYDFAEGKIHKCWQKGTPKKIISINTITHSLPHIFNFELEVEGNVGEILKWLTANYRGNGNFNQYLNFCSDFRRQRIKFLTTPTLNGSNAKNYFIEIRKYLKDADILVLDVGIHKHLGGLILERNMSNSIVFSNGLSSAGFGFPAALGVKLISPEQEVFCITGDGGFMMNFQELETIVRRKIKLIIILFEDKEYGLIKQYQRMNYDFNYGTKFENPDFSFISRAFGLDYSRVESVDNIGACIESARLSKNSSLIHIETHYDYSKLL